MKVVTLVFLLGACGIAAQYAPFVTDDDLDDGIDLEEEEEEDLHEPEDDSGVDDAYGSPGKMWVASKKAGPQTHPAHAQPTKKGGVKQSTQHAVQSLEADMAELGSALGGRGLERDLLGLGSVWKSIKRAVGMEDEEDREGSAVEQMDKAAADAKEEKEAEEEKAKKEAAEDKDDAAEEALGPARKTKKEVDKQRARQKKEAAIEYQRSRIDEINALRAGKQPKKKPKKSPQSSGPKKGPKDKKFLEMPKSPFIKANTEAPYKPTGVLEYMKSLFYNRPPLTHTDMTAPDPGSSRDGDSGFLVDGPRARILKYTLEGLHGEDLERIGQTSAIEKPVKDFPLPQVLEHLMDAVNKVGREDRWKWQFKFRKTADALLKGRSQLGNCKDFALVMYMVATTPEPMGLGLDPNKVEVGSYDGSYGNGFTTIPMAASIDPGFPGNGAIKVDTR